MTRDTEELEAAGVRGRVMKEFVTDRDDYDAALYLVEHTRLLPRHDEIAAQLARIGEDGVVLAFVGHAPAHLVMREWTGYEGFYYQLQDNGPQVERLIAALDEQQRQVVQIAAGLPGAGDRVRRQLRWLADAAAGLPAATSSRPHRRLVDACHAAGKIVASHCDGRNDGLLGLIAESGFDVAEAFTPPPMTNIGVGHGARRLGRAAWPSGAAWRPPPSRPMFSEDEFDAHVWQTLDESDGRGLALGTGDNVPTDGSLERVRRVGRLVERVEPGPPGPRRLTWC